MAEVDAAGNPPASVWTAPAPVPALEERERSVLAELARESDASVSFQGLRRQLGLHQQVLTRTLRRLESAGLVAHAERGYQLTERGSAALRDRLASTPRAHAATLVQAILPPHVSGGEAAAQLARRWFGGLRWYGQSDGPGETTLHWVVEPGRHRVTVRVSEGSITLEADVPPQDSARVYAAARPVLAAIAEIYGMPSRRDTGVSAMFGAMHGMAA